LLSQISKNAFDGFYLKRVDFVWGRQIKHGEVGNIKLMRLAKKGKGKWHGKVHEVWDVRGKIGEMEFPLIHTPHQSVREFIDDIDNYSSLRSSDAKKVSKKNKWEIFFYPVGKFFYNYIFKKGYKDGVAGLIYAVLMSFHSFLVRAKLYLASQ